MKKELAIIAAAFIAATCFAQKAEVRKWIRKDGSVVGEGVFVNVYTNEKSGVVCVLIKKTDGSETGPIIKNLCDADQAYVEQMAATPAAAE